MNTATRPAPTLKPLRGIRVLSLALNLPGPAALMRLKHMGATCVKVEPPAPGGGCGDPMGQYSPSVYAALHVDIKVVPLDLKSERGQAALHRSLARTDVLLTSFRPSALRKLGLGWQGLHKRYPALSMVAIVGAPGARAEAPGHDLTYLAEVGLITGTDLPATLFADMGGAIAASEAVLKAALALKTSGRGSFQEVGLSEAAAWLALPHTWGLTRAQDALGGAHAGYRVYACKDGRVAVAALEPHFAMALCAAADVPVSGYRALFEPEVHTAITAFMSRHTRQQLDTLAAEKDIPLHTLAR